MAPWDNVIQRLFRRSEPVSGPQDGDVAVRRWVHSHRKGRAKAGVVIATNPAEPLPLTAQPGQTVKDICMTAAQKTGISNILLDMFTLVSEDGKYLLNPRQQLTREECQQTYQFQLTFKVCHASQLREYDVNALEYYFQQNHRELLDGRLPEYTGEENQRFFVILTIIEIVLRARERDVSASKMLENPGSFVLQSLLRKGIFQEYSLKDVKKYLKPKLQKYESLNKEKLMANFLHAVENSDDFFIHKFTVYKHYSRPGSPIPAQKEFELLISADGGIQKRDINFVEDIVKDFSEVFSLELDPLLNRVIISRTEERPEVLIASSPKDAQSIITLIEGYYRLLVNRYANLRDQGFRLSLRPQIHGPLMRKKAESVLQELGKEDGLFLVRQKRDELGCFVLSLYHENKIKHYEISCNEGKYSLKRTNVKKEFDDIESLIKHYEKSQDGLEVCLGRRCLPDTSGYAAVFDFQPIIPTTARPQKIDSYLFEEVNQNQLKIEQTFDTKGEFGLVYHGKWYAPDAEEPTEVVTRKLKKMTFSEDFFGVADNVVRLRNQNLVRFYGMARMRDAIALVFEYVPKGALDEYLLLECKRTSGIPKCQVMLLASQVAEGMMYLQSKDCVHGRLSAHNILVANEECVKISDVGLLDFKSHGGVFFPEITQHGNSSHCWHAPEVLIKATPQQSPFTHASDVWSLGVTMWEMFALRKPFHWTTSSVLDREQILARYSKNQHLNTNRPNIPKGVANIIHRCWDHFEDKRISFEEIFISLRNLVEDDPCGELSEILIVPDVVPEDWERELLHESSKATAPKQRDVDMVPDENYAGVATISNTSSSAECTSCLTGPHTHNLQDISIRPSLIITNKHSLHRTISDPGSPPGGSSEVTTLEYLTVQRKSSLSRTSSFPSTNGSQTRRHSSCGFNNVYAKMTFNMQGQLEMAVPYDQETLLKMQEGSTSSAPFDQEANSRNTDEHAEESSISEQVMTTTCAIETASNAKEISVPHSPQVTLDILKGWVNEDVQPLCGQEYRSSNSEIPSSVNDFQVQEECVSNLTVRINDNGEQSERDSKLNQIEKVGEECDHAMDFLGSLVETRSLDMLPCKSNNEATEIIVNSAQSKLHTVASGKCSPDSSGYVDHNTAGNSRQTKEISDSNIEFNSRENNLSADTELKEWPETINANLDDNIMSVRSDYRELPCKEMKEGNENVEEQMFRFLSKQSDGASTETRELSSKTEEAIYTRYRDDKCSQVCKQMTEVTCDGYVPHPGTAAPHEHKQLSNIHTQLTEPQSAVQSTEQSIAGSLTYIETDGTKRCNDNQIRLSSLMKQEGQTSGFLPHHVIGDLSLDAGSGEGNTCSDSHIQDIPDDCTAHTNVLSSIWNGLAVEETGNIPNSLRNQEGQTSGYLPHHVIGDLSLDAGSAEGNTCSDSHIQDIPDDRTVHTNVLSSIWNGLAVEETGNIPNSLTNQEGQTPGYLPHHVIGGLSLDAGSAQGITCSDSHIPDDRTAHTNVLSFIWNGMPVEETGKELNSLIPADGVNWSDSPEGIEMQALSHAACANAATNDNNEGLDIIEPSALERLEEKIPQNLRVNVKDLHIHEEIGKGNFGVVRKGKRVYQRRDGKTIKEDVAVKELRPNKDKKAEQDFITEADNMVKIAHIKNKHIIKLIGIAIGPDEENPSIKRLMIVTEFAPLNNLTKYLEREKHSLTIPRLLDYCLQIVTAMSYLEKEPLVHRDLAARNILVVREDLVKISDFGLSRLKDYYKTTGGTFPTKWYAPESIEMCKFTSKSDVWSFGVTMWEMFSYGAKPYEGIEKQVLDYIKDGGRLPCPNNCPEDIYALMKKCWHEESIKRPSFNALQKVYLPELTKEYPIEIGLA